MTNTLSKLTLACLALVLSAAAVSAQLHPQKKGSIPIAAKTQSKMTTVKPDVSFQPLVYLTGKSEDEIDPAQNRSVAAGGTINVTVADAVGFHNGQGYIDVNAAVIIRRSGGNIKQPLDVRLEFAEPAKGDEPSITFAAGQTTAEYHIRMTFMKTGPQKVRFTLDPENKLAESNEKNNDLVVTLNVAPWNVQ